jgi:hypothetical protein
VVLGWRRTVGVMKIIETARFLVGGSIRPAPDEHEVVRFANHVADYFGSEGESAPYGEVVQRLAHNWVVRNGDR